MKVEDGNNQEWVWLEEKRPEFERIALMGGGFGKKCPYAKPMCSHCAWKHTCTCIDNPCALRVILY